MTSVPPPGYESGRSWSFSQGKPDPAPDASPDRLSRRLYQLVGALSVLLIALLAVAWLHGSEETSLNPIAEAAGRAGDEPGGRIELRATYKVKGWSYSPIMIGIGAFNGDLERTQIDATLHIRDRRLRFQTIADGDSVYVHSPTFARELPPGKEWLGLEPFLGHDPEAAFGSGSALTQQLQVLESVGARVREVGRETVHGVATTKYMGVVDMGRVVAILHQRGELRFAAVMRRALQMGPRIIPVWVWIDDEGMLRRWRRDQVLPARRGRREVKTTMWVDLYDFGAEPHIEVPTPDDVFDATPLAQAELNLFGEAYSEPVVPTGEPLPPAEFRAEVGKTCAELRQSARPLEKKLKTLSRRAGYLAATRGLGSPATRHAYLRVALGAFEPLVDLADGWTDRLEAIAPSADLEDEYRRYLRLTNIQVEMLRAAARALEVVDYKLVDRLDKRNERLKRRLKRLAKKLGAGRCEDSAE